MLKMSRRVCEKWRNLSENALYHSASFFLFSEIEQLGIAGYPDIFCKNEERIA